MKYAAATGVAVITQIFLPVEKVYKVQAGKKSDARKELYPGYVMIEAIDGNDDR